MLRFNVALHLQGRFDLVGSIELNLVVHQIRTRVWKILHNTSLLVQMVYAWRLQLDHFTETYQDQVAN